ncbi:hypothetical protein VOM14_12060 [Paraburkholderia sp. MPAMCS5]|uniref:hypothetical protein n=1 Tax=Paraburkholderia sp. MPAMCS5 TaxID=3112563 RepID=UPI002E173F91|nr:hypothetical protein [Paraburkholderia sp. MPAMCS5]
MNMRTAEFLVGVAIVTSAGVMQIREHMQPREAVGASAAQSAQTAPSSCAPGRHGVVPASCEPTREARPARHAPMSSHGAMAVWV